MSQRKTSRCSTTEVDRYYSERQIYTIQHVVESVLIVWLLFLKKFIVYLITCFLCKQLSLSSFPATTA